MPVTKDIGGGIQLLDQSGIERDAVGDLTKQLGLVDLVNKINQAPAELAIKTADAKLRQDQVDQLSASHQLASAELDAKRGAESRAKSEGLLKQLTSLPSVFAQDFETGKMYLQQILPGATAKDRGDGTMVAMVPSSEGFKTLIIPTKKLTDPEKIASLEEGLRKQYESSPQFSGHQVVNEFYKNFKDSVALGTGAGDMAATFSLIKMYDRQNQVRENQVVALEQVPGFSQLLLNQYNKMVSAKANGATLGRLDSSTRKDLGATADLVYKNSKEGAVQQAKFYAGLANPQNGLNPRAIVAPVGDVTYDALFPQAPSVTSAKGPLVPGADKKSSGPSPQEAGILPTGKAPGEAQAPPSFTLDQLTQQALQNSVNTHRQEKKKRDTSPHPLFLPNF